MLDLLQKLAALSDELDKTGSYNTANQLDGLIKGLGEGLIKNAFIRKRKGKWCVMSHKGKSLGCYQSKKAAERRLRQVEFFKYHK